MSDLLTADELAERLRVKAITIREWAREGRIPSFHITPKVIRFDPTAVIQSLQEREKERK